MIPKNRMASAVAGLTVLLQIAPIGWAAQTFPLDSTIGLQPHKVTVEAVTYRNRKAVRVMPLPEE